MDLVGPRGQGAVGELGLLFGAGFVRTTDDLTAMQAESDPIALATQFQRHPTTLFGGCAQVWFGERTGLRLEALQSTYVETFSSTTLEMKKSPFISAELLLRLRPCQTIRW